MVKGWYGDRQAHSLASKGIRTCANGQSYRIGSHATSHYVKDGVLRVIYHGTEVVKYDFNNGLLVLDTGGWFTNTTKARMNQASNQYDLGFTVYQKDYNWFVEFDTGEVIPFNGSSNLVIDTEFKAPLFTRGEKKSPTAKNINKTICKLEDNASETAKHVKYGMRKVDSVIDESASKTALYLKKWGRKIDDDASKTARHVKKVFEVK